VLPDGAFLLVGHDRDDLHEARDLVQEGLPLALGLALPLSLLGGLIVSALILRRLDSINRSTLEIRRGNLHKRIPVSGANDEFDRLAAHLNAMLDGIQELTEGLRQVSNDIAHDLRTPLTRIRTQVEQARQTPAPQRDSDAVLDSVMREIDRVLEAFAAMLRIGQMDAGTPKPSFADFDLSETLQELVQDFEPIAKEAGQSLHASIAPGLRFHGEKRLVIQMLVNLIENAITHSRGDRIEVALARRDGGLEACVADDGVGIPEAEREKVLQRFYRLDKSRHSDGFGLGLSLVAAIAKLHKIDVSLSDNRPGLRVVLAFPGNG